MITEHITLEQANMIIEKDVELATKLMDALNKIIDEKGGFTFSDYKHVLCELIPEYQES